ncbi:DUF6049 family protein [Luethyella okanaganae]|uniref:DUF6049 family protein n=1 Tax=Luethyella okanaganae TaxID=69372 RepID=A0ABW1VES7_9MICO
MRIAAAAAAAALSFAPVSALAGTTTAGTTILPAAANTDDRVRIAVAPSDSAVLGPAHDLAVNVTITNSTEQSLDPGTVHVILDDTPIDTRSALESWLHPDDSPSTPGDIVASVPTPTIAQATSAVVPVTVPAASVGLDGSPLGAYGLTAKLTVDATANATASGRGIIVWSPGDAVVPTRLAIAMPITTPSGSDGLIPASTLETLTAPNGLLTRQLESVANRPVALGIDPMIIVSIRALGTSAPQSALDWLEQLYRLGNEVFPLAYADADPAVQVQAGLTTLLAPTSFDYTLDPANFAGPVADKTPMPAPGDATPTPAPAPGAVPTLDELLTWPYTVTGIAWPGDATVTTGDLKVFGANAVTTTILSSSNVTSQWTPRGSTTVGEMKAAVSDTELSAAVRDAVTAVTDVAWQGAMARATAVLAVAAAEDPTSTSTVLATLGRGWPPTTTRLTQTLDALATLPFAAPSAFSHMLTETPTAVALRDSPESEARVGAVSMLAAREGEIGDFSTTLADPTVLTGRERARLLALLANSWRANEEDWHTAVADHLSLTRGILDSVSVVQSSSINVVGSTAQIPIAVNNKFDQPVTVRVQVVPSNPRLVVEQQVGATIAAESSNTVQVPVSAKVGNGQVVLSVTLFSSTGTQLGSVSTIPVNVQADWEGLGAAILASLVVLFFGFGIWRNIRRRRRERAAGADQAAAAAEGSVVGEAGAGKASSTRQAGDEQETSPPSNDGSRDGDGTSTTPDAQRNSPRE